MSIINSIFFISLCVHLIFGYDEGRRIQNIELNVKRYKQYSNTYIDTERHVVYPFDPLYITVKNLNIDFIRCRSYHTLYKYNCTITNHDAMGSEIQISSVTYGMSDMWVCGFRGLYGNTNIYLEIEVVGAKPPQSVIINNVLLPVQKNTEIIRNYNCEKYITEYYYEEGDIVDLKCIAQKEKYCSLQWHYNYVIPRKDIPTSFIQDRTKLKAIHNNSYIVCTSSCYKMNSTSLLVKFILRAPEKKATLKINNIQIASTAVGYQPTVSYRTFYVNYAYFMISDLSIVCDMFGEGYLSFGCILCDIKDQSDDSLKMKITIIPKKISRIKFTVRNEKNIFEKSVVTFTSIAVNEYEMKVWDGFQFLAEKTTPPNVHLSSKTTSKDIGLQDNYIKRTMYSATTTSITTISSIPTTVATEIESPQQWVPIVISLLLIIFLIIISTAIYKLRKHMLIKRQAYKNCEESLNDNGSSIAPYPAQWNSEATYTNIDGFTNDIRNTDDKIPELDNVYATPDIKYETLVNPKNTDYQNLAILNNTKPVPKDVYAQVVPKSKREKTYANTGRNLSPDYEETMYAEINSTS